MRAGIVFVIVEGRALVKTCCAVGRTVKDINITYVINILHRNEGYHIYYLSSSESKQR